MHRVVTKVAPHRRRGEPTKLVGVTGRVVRVKSEAEKTAEAKREKRERRAARKARKIAKAIVMQRRRERAAAAMAELDAEKLRT